MDNLKLWAGEALIPRINPMPIYAFAREEKLVGRFEKIWDPMPGKMDLVGSLRAIEAAPEIISGNDCCEESDCIISAPDPRQFQNLALSSLNNNCKYLGIFSHCMQLAGLRRYKNLYSICPPSRIYIIAEAWSQTRKNRGGSDGAWQPAIWAVWDGENGPAIYNRPIHPTIHWISDTTSSM